MAQEFAAAAIGLVSLVVLLVALTVLYAPLLPAVSWRLAIGQSFACALPGIVAWMILGPIISVGLRPIMMPALGLLGAIAAYLVTLVARSLGASFTRSMIFGSLWAVVVFVPTAARTFKPFGAYAPLGLNPIDHGGAHVLGVSVGAAMLAIVIAQRKSLIRGARIVLSRRTGSTALAVVVLAWIGWLVGAEFALDAITGLIILNATVSAGAGAIGWIAVQQISHGEVGIRSLGRGLVCGSIAVTAGAPLFTPVSAAVAGLVAGAVACVYSVRRQSLLGNQLRFQVNTHLLGGGLGVVSLGVLATGSGFLFTGQTVVLQEQLLSVVVTAAWSFFVTSACWWLLILLARIKMVARDRILSQQ